jgi:Dyp-type peroxidase family
MAATTAPLPPEAEPLLDIDQIQGNVFPGFNKPHQSYIGLTIENAPAAKAWLKNILAEVSTVRKVMDDRKAYRALKKQLGRKVTDADGYVVTHMGIGFSYGGMRKLTLDAQSFESDAYRLGLPERSSLLGDPTDRHDPGDPHNWVVGGPGNIPDVLVIVNSDSASERTARTEQVKSSAEKSGLKATYQENGDALPGDLRGHEHFGFHDNVSQPGIRGLISDDPLEYLARRYVDPSVVPESLLFGSPGQYLIWPGEYVFGYPGQTQDPLIPAATNTIQPTWTKDGSFLVFRRYRQDVELFWNVMEQEAGRLRKKPGFEWANPVALAARVVGRWPSGAPLARVPAADNPELGEDDLANNHFGYASDTCPVKLTGGAQDGFPNAKADPIGAVCPLGSHIRKVNTRDSSNDTGATLGSFTRRIMRRGIEFGETLLEGPITGDRPQLKSRDPLKGNRGLLFVGFCASIEDQFEFLRNRWMSNRFTPQSPSGNDVFIGLNANYGQKRVREMNLFGSGLESQTLSTGAAWVVPTGGGYYFVPSMSAIATVLAT